MDWSSERVLHGHEIDINDEDRASEPGVNMKLTTILRHEGAMRE